GVAVRPLHGRDPRVQPLRERDVGLPGRVVRPELLVHDLPAPFLDELPRRDHLSPGALRLVHIRSPRMICRRAAHSAAALRGPSSVVKSVLTASALPCFLRTTSICMISSSPSSNVTEIGGSRPGPFGSFIAP